MLPSRAYVTAAWRGIKEAARRPDSENVCANARKTPRQGGDEAIDDPTTRAGKQAAVDH
jgi:hypothetical protein